MAKKDELFQEVSQALVQLAIHAGMMSTVLSVESHAPARDGWNSWLRETRDWALRKTEEVHDFAEHYDQ